MVFSWTRVAGAGTWGQLWRCWSAIYCIHEISVCILRPLMINCEWITEYWMIVNVYDKLWMDNNEYNYENLVSSLLWSISWRLSHKIGHDGNPKINHSQILGVWNRVYHGSPAINVKWPLLMVGFRILPVMLMVIICYNLFQDVVFNWFWWSFDCFKMLYHRPK